MLAVLVACGGGGGGGGGPDLIDLTAQNRDSVAHAAAVGTEVLRSSRMLAVGSSVMGSGGAASFVGRAMTAVAGRETLKANVPLPTLSCNVSGNYTGWWDDVNNNGQLDLGEPVTLVFNQCQDDAYQIINGTVVTIFTQASQSSMGGTQEMKELSLQATNGRHGLTLNGLFGINCTALTDTSARCVSTVSEPVLARVHTHLPFDDSVTLHGGFVEDATYDEATGHETASIEGTVTSVAAGGAFSVRTEAAVGRLWADPYPHEGRVRISGERGTMLISPLSATQVKVELDPTDDGVFESSEVEDWDWLL